MNTYRFASSAFALMGLLGLCLASWAGYEGWDWVRPTAQIGLLILTAIPLAILSLGDKKGSAK